MREPGNLLYMRARQYNPHIGIFLMEDPVHGDLFTPMDMHEYIYASNNPLLLIDPTGESAQNWSQITLDLIQDTIKAGNAGIGLLKVGFGPLESSVLGITMTLPTSILSGAVISARDQYVTNTLAPEIANLKSGKPGQKKLSMPLGYTWEVNDSGVAFNRQAQIDALQGRSQQSDPKAKVMSVPINTQSSRVDTVPTAAVVREEPLNQRTSCSSLIVQSMAHIDNAIMGYLIYESSSSIIPEPVTPERYEPKYRIINKTQAKDMR